MAQTGSYDEENAILTQVRIMASHNPIPSPSGDGEGEDRAGRFPIIHTIYAKQNTRRKPDRMTKKTPF